jgi:hypothetical protein
LLRQFPVQLETAQDHLDGTSTDHSSMRDVGSRRTDTIAKMGWASRSAIAILGAAACSAPAKPPQPPPVATETLAAPPVAIEPERERDDRATPEPEPEPARVAFPTECSGEGADGVCSPPARFVKVVCGGFAKPDVALLLFAKGSPWTRAYLRLNVSAWYTGSRSAKVGLKFDEEVIVMSHSLPPGGIIVNGGGGPFDVMRLDGNCATLSSEEVTLKRPPAPKHPPVPWRQLDPRTRAALLADAAIADVSRLDDDCTDPSVPACAKVESKRTAAILDFMARGGKIPLVPTGR